MEKLTEDSWIDIFKYLHPQDIENAADSCENWRNIITASLMRKHILRINFKGVEGKPWMKLPYQNFYLERIRDKNSNKIEEFLQDIHHLSVNKVFIKLSNFVYAIKVVNNFPNITTLVVENMTGWDKQDDTKIDLPNLTRFKIDIFSIPLLSRFRSHKIEVFIASFYFNTELDRAQEKSVDSFFQTCDKLKHLTMISCFSEAIMKIKSQLETFEFIEGGEIPSSFLQFLEYQKSSLKNLTLEVRFDDEIANFIYFQMNLEKIVDCRYRHGQIQKLKKITVKNLTINIQDDNFEYFEKLFQCCEMLEVLDVDLPEKRPLEFLRLLSNLPKLKSLKLNREPSTAEELQQTFKFNRLERLILFHEFTADESVKVIRCCPNLTHLTMYAILNKNDFEKIFQDCNKIEEIFLPSVFHNETITDENAETFKKVGSKIKFKVETDNNEVIEKLSDAKNRLTVIFEDYQRCDPFVVRPRILSGLHFHFSDDEGYDYFYEDRDFNYADSD